MVIAKAALPDASLADVAPPPTYAASEEAPGRPTSPLPLGPPDLPRANHLTIERATTIEGSFIIDPSLAITEDALSPMGSDETAAGRRANMRLSSAHAGIKADVWVLDGADEQPTWLVFSSPHSNTEIRIHSVGRNPCTVDVISTHSHSKLHLPGDWQGLIVIERMHGTVELEPRDHVTVLSEVGGVMKCFIGDTSLLTNGPWTGHRLNATVTQGIFKLRVGHEHPRASGSSGAKFEQEKKKKKMKWSWWPAIGYVDASSDSDDEAPTIV